MPFRVAPYPGLLTSDHVTNGPSSNLLIRRFHTMHPSIWAERQQDRPTAAVLIATVIARMVVLTTYITAAVLKSERHNGTSRYRREYGDARTDQEIRNSGCDRRLGESDAAVRWAAHEAAMRHATDP